MYIQEVKITNFRGLNIEIENLKEDFLIIGKNDSGKSNFCYALRKVLDYNTRRIPLSISDSSNYNKENISIYIKLNLKNINKAHKNRLGNLIERVGNEYFLNIYFEAVFSNETMHYDESITIGSLDSTTYATNVSNPLDKILDVIYINPNYDFEKDKKTFFKFRQQKSIEENDTINPMIRDSVTTLNESIKNDEFIKNLVTEINSQDGFDEIFEDVEFQIRSNVDIGNIYKSLNIIPYVKNTDESINIGDGKTKTLSMLLQKITYDNDKQKILIVEEPENHLYPLLQKYYVKSTTKFNLEQMIYTSHSPYIIDYRKMGQIVKFIVDFKNGNKNVICKTLNIKSNDYEAFGYMLNEEISEMFFYDKVLLVEGDSEKYFYNALSIKDESFNKFLIKNKMGIFSVYGIDFGPAKNILSQLGIEVFIKTDNDIFLKQRRYAGLSRVFDCLDENGKNKLKEILDVETISKNNFKFAEGNSLDRNIEEKMSDITELFKQYGVLLSNHHDGFERDFLEFLGRKDTYQDDLDFLRKAKLKNLHTFIVENGIVLKINEENKNSILVDFFNDSIR